MPKNRSGGYRDNELQRLIEKLSVDEISRREFMKAGMKLGVSISLLSSLEMMFGPDKAFSAEDVPDELMKKVEQEESRVNVFNWSFYIDPGRQGEFQKEFGIEVSYDLYESNEQMLTKIRAGGSPYDVVYPSQGTVTRMRHLDLLQPLNHDWIPNMNGLMDRFIDPPFDPGNKHSVAYQWGTTGYSHHTGKTEGDPNVGHWDLVFDPESGEEYSNKMAMMNARDDVIGAALKHLGYSNNTGQPWKEGDRDKLMEAKEVLMRQKPWLKAYIFGGPMKKSLISEELWIGHEWSGDALFVADNNENYEYVFPKEGNDWWVDSMCIPKDAPHPATAHLWINYMLRPKVQAGVTSYVWYPSPVQKAKQYIDDEILNNPAVYPPEETLERSEPLKAYTGKAESIRDRIWQELKA